MILLFPNGRKQYALRQISTDTILGRNKPYPNAVDDAPIVGLDPDLEYLVMDNDDPSVVDYDSRVAVLVSQEAKVGTTLKLSYTLETRSKDDIKGAVLNAERAEIEKHLPSSDRDKTLIIVLSALAGKIDSQILTEEQQAAVAKLAVAAGKVWENDAEAAAKIAIVEADGVPDLDAGWAVKSAAGEEVVP